jgi:hypothetical protein
MRAYFRRLRLSHPTPTHCECDTDGDNRNAFQILDISTQLSIGFSFWIVGTRIQKQIQQCFVHMLFPLVENRQSKTCPFDILRAGSERMRRISTNDFMRSCRHVG